MPSRADSLIQSLNLQPHPEGGHFREMFRSADSVSPADGRPDRSAVTTIFFLLTRGQRSRWHRVASDEVWHFYEGDPLELFWVHPDARVEHAVLREVSGDDLPVATVPAGCWQAARSSGDYTLVGCTVGPGFDFADFQLIESAEDFPIDSDRLPVELRDFL